MTLTDLINKINEKKLPKEGLEHYRDQLSGLYSKMCIEMADILKAKALFIDGYEAKTDIEKKRKWQVTQKGLRELELKQYIIATKEMLSSLKSRIFSQIYD